MKEKFLYFKAFFLFMILLFDFRIIINIYLLILFLKNQIRYKNIELWEY
jgi:hypothetical protein